MAKNNTCDTCGHYLTSHSAGGCTVRVLGEDKGFEFCACIVPFDPKGVDNGSFIRYNE